MDAVCEASLLVFVHAQWRRHSPAQLQRGVWVSAHESIDSADPDADPLAQPLRRAWWLDWEAIRPRPAASFKVFYDHLRPRGAQAPFEIGLSAFAPFPWAPFYCLHNLRGPLDGDGWRLRVDVGGVHVLEKRWVS